MAHGVIPPGRQLFNDMSDDDDEFCEHAPLTGVGPSLRSTQPSDTAKFEHLESLDYEVCDNTVQKATEARQSSLDPIRYSFLKYTICCLVGIIVALIAFAVNFGVENIAGMRFWLTFQAARESYVMAWLVFVLCQVLLTLCAMACVLYVSPAAAGSGIPDVKAYLNGVDVPAVLLFRTLVAKVLGSLGSVGGGLAVGKEGPFVHIGACVASMMSQGGTWENVPNLKWLRRFKNDRERRDIVTCGACAGVAAAFRAPVGAMLFGLEALSSYWSEHLLLTCFFTTAVVNVTVRALLNVCSGGGCGFFGDGDPIIFHVNDAQKYYEAFELFPMLLVAILGGLLGSLFNLLNAKASAWRRAHLYIHGNRAKILDGVVISILTSTAAICLPFYFDCQECPADAVGCPRTDNSHSGNFVPWNCAAENQYNPLATLFFNTQDDAIRNLFSAKTPHEYSPAVLLVFFLSFYTLSIITYGIAVPAGLFVPGILTGAAYGRLVGVYVKMLHPDSLVDEGTYALLGSASYMAGSMRIAVSVCVMLLELTRNLNLLPLLMLVLIIAKAVGDGTGIPGIYENQIRIKSFPVLPPTGGKQLRHVTAGELITARGPPVTLARVVRVRDVVSALTLCSHNGFAVVDTGRQRATAGAEATGAGAPEQGGGTLREGSELMGIVLRHHLLVLLQSQRSFQHAPEVTPNSQRIAFMYDITDFDKPVSTESPTIEDIAPTLSPAAASMWIDLGPYINPPSYIVQETTTATKAYDLFRSLGLRHLCVVPRTPQVIGILSRKDFVPEHVDGIIRRRVGSASAVGTSFLAHELPTSAAFDARPGEATDEVLGEVRRSPSSLDPQMRPELFLRPGTARGVARATSLVPGRSGPVPE